ncbi:hypothetical protein MYCTH_2308878 [Thermothelomyces thermophilus ATCC 42464]|uniref:Major facilitator superfamily (MFS) profile domain-containing protein n=1 Tax=Thermothelomyces thermophilus (strain ATCC 42464 / BCRC 31852 / DSM 1799) TaxID=573729 RepID=G2QKF0_THET4|nr:uncharacterized protein MYCTH_2308878 [Thermothelomyces thermophilus ATCC 42464]AEO60056.1 hypothetical protein MYCTH_2308878 [Thermothelomyces thermophilus ATCC 42464]
MTETTPPAAGDPADVPPPHPKYYRSPAASRRAVRPLLLLVALVNLAWSLYQLPLSRVLESRLCREHYAARDPSVLRPDGSVPEQLCKIDPVQQPLGRIQGMTEAAWVAGDFLMTIPLVCLADHLGHRFVLWLNLVPRVLLLAWTFAVGYFDHALPVDAILAAPVFSFLGGDCVFNSIVYAIVSDLADDNVLRATFFGYVNAVSSIFSSQLGPALASATMSTLLWLPLWLGIAILLLAIPVISALPLPSTRSYPGSATITGIVDEEEAADDPHHHATPLLAAAAAAAVAAGGGGGGGGRGGHPHTSTLRSLAARRVGALLALLASPTRSLVLLLSVFFLASLASSDTKLLPLYISNRYAWTFASVGYLLSAKALFNFFLLWVAVPRVLRWQQQQQQRRKQRRKQLGRRQEGTRRRSSSSSTATTTATTPVAVGGGGGGGGGGGNGDRSGSFSSRPSTPDELDTDADWRDVLRNAETCLWLSAAGASCIAGSPSIGLLVPSLGLYALGIALPMFTYSLLRAPGMGLVGKRGGRDRSRSGSRGRGRGWNRGGGGGGGGGDGEEGGDGLGAPVFSVVMLVRTLGTLVGAVVMPALWVTGLGVEILPLPYVASAFFYAIAAVVVKRIHV